MNTCMVDCGTILRSYKQQLAKRKWPTIIYGLRASAIKLRYGYQAFLN
jgi:hypothetical protein